MYANLAEFLLRHRTRVIAGFIVLGITTAAFLPFLQFQFTPQQLFRSTTGALEFREEFAAEFGREDNVVSIIFSVDDVFDPAFLEGLRDTTFELRDLDVVHRAESISTMPVPRAGDDPGVLSTSPIVPAQNAVTKTQANALRTLSSTEPLLKNTLVSKNANATILLVWLDADLQEVDELSEALDAIYEVLHEHLPDQVYQVGGIPFIRVDIVASLKRQQVTFIPMTAAAYALILIVLFRRFSGLLLPLAVVASACLMTVAMMVLTKSSINIINNVLPSLIFIIGISDSIHMLVRDAEEMESGATRADAIRAMVKHTGLACLLTTSTTAVGFISLLSADTEILKEFGWQAAFGVMCAYVGTVLLLPAALSGMRPVRRRKPDTDQEPILERTLEVIAAVMLGRPKLWLTVGLAIAALAAFYATRVEIDTILLEVYDPDHPSWQTTMELEREFGGILPIEISLRSPHEDTFKDPEVYAKIHELQRFAAESRIVLSTRSLVDFHQAARQALLDDPAQRDVMPESRQQIEQIQLLIEGSPDERTGVRQFVTPDFQHVRVLLMVSDAGAKAQLVLGEALHQKLEELFPKDGDVQARLTGDAYVASLALNSFIRDLFFSLLLAIVIIFAMMAAVFRSLKLGLISVLPNTIPLLITFGYMGFQGIDLNTTTIICFAISLGLAVDDTIHFLERFREERNRNPDDIQAVLLATFRGAGRAILLTSVMLLIGLGVLLFSDFVPTRVFATLTGITIFSAVFAEFVILAPLLMLVYGKKGHKPDDLASSIPG